jgi:endonuclease YncB( thermonuclease family)
MSVPAPEIGLVSPCVIDRVVDGDTVELTITRRVTVRLLDCWAPESRTRNSNEKRRGILSKSHLQELLPVGSQAVVQLPGSPEGDISDLITLGRVLGRIWVAGSQVDVSTLQVEAGHARRTKEV